jgi:hypothetical protein
MKEFLKICFSVFIFSIFISISSAQEEDKDHPRVHIPVGRYAPTKHEGFFMLSMDIKSLY